MSINYSLISTFKFLKVLRFLIIIVVISCEDPDYNLNNPFDPNNMDLDPPALFFHPFILDASFGETIQVELYGYQLDSSAAAHFDIRYDWGSLEYVSVIPGPFFEGINSPIEITVHEQGVLNLFMYYLPDINSNQSMDGTWSIATIYFSTISRGESELLYGPNTTIRDASNNILLINDYGKGYINVE